MRVRKPVLLASVGLVALLLAYVYVGFRTCADSVRMNVISPGWIRSGDFVSCEVENEAFSAFPFVNPFYSVRLVVQAESANNAFGCFEDLDGERWNFTDRSVELGTLGPGESRSVGFFLLSMFKKNHCA